MNYKGDAHAWIADGKIPDEVEERLILFCEKIGNESQL